MDKKHKIVSNCMLYKYLEEIGIRNLSLNRTYSICTSFYNLGVESFWKAIEYVHQLPYGRNTDRSNLQQVLTEQKGTCSTKHALSASLAEEINIPLKLNFRFAFEDFKLHRIMANYMPTNIRSANLLNRLGFEMRGMLKLFID